MTDRSFQRANDESRERFARLIATLTPTQLTVDVGGGWTVASVLAHMGFWDRWQAERLADTMAGRLSAADDTVTVEELNNLALDPYLSEIGPDRVAALALEAATKLDALVAHAPDATVEALEGGTSDYVLHRHRHRDKHIDQIERALEATAQAAAAKPLDRSFIDRNAESRRSMAALIGRLTAADYARPIEPTEEGSWTIGQTLGHLAFWDRSWEARWKDAVERTGSGGQLDPIGIAGEWLVAINPPIATLVGAWTELLGTAIGAEALAAAEAIDGLIEPLAGGIPADLAEERPASVKRWMHRDSHLRPVEAALAR
ncbi:MAG: maleylpyruvate isomerase N-terminal domain-containing protein [Candidatus Limnocylindrales bacterium]|jgi:uncharacterized damage-inducible protein DinB